MALFEIIHAGNVCKRAFFSIHSLSRYLCCPMLLLEGIGKGSGIDSKIGEWVKGSEGSMGASSILCLLSRCLYCVTAILEKLNNGSISVG